MKLKIGSLIIPQKEEEEVELYLEKSGEDVFLRARTPQTREMGLSWDVLRFRESSSRLVMERIANIEDPLISTDWDGRINVIYKG